MIDGANSTAVFPNANYQSPAPPPNHMPKISFVDEDPALAKLYVEIQSRTDQAQADQPNWPCHKGCDLCCRQLAQIPDITAVEWQRLWRGMQTLPNDIQQSVIKKIMALADHENGRIVCPLLDEQAGACRVYDSRPAACRMYGFYVSRHNNQWCDQIETLFQAGALEGVTLGNLPAMQRQFAQRFGASRSLVDWLQETLAD